ncbi:segregation/condensation protein A [Candidatus Wolfebacteria bacterium]|nr:segregation/condensation protein A [Candidatus Wolfebacteria bacterium]
MKTFEVQLNAFSGPIETLLDLIESRKLAVTDVSIAEVTALFLQYVEEMASRDESSSDHAASSRRIADFLVVASHLLLIKSKVLLPSLELSPREEEEIRDLETRLRILRSIRQYGLHVKALWDSEDQSLSRPLLKDQPIIFYPAPNITPDSLLAVLRELSETFAREARETQTIPQSLVTLEEKIAEIIERLNGASGRRPLAFGHLTLEKNKQEVIILFLALLHLLQNRLVHTEQKKHFSDIIVRANHEA